MESDIWENRNGKKATLYLMSYIYMYIQTDRQTEDAISLMETKSKIDVASYVRIGRKMPVKRSFKMPRTVSARKESFRDSKNNL